jgi:hypothetical protein
LHRTLARLTSTNTSPGLRFRMTLSGTRESAHPIQRYFGACALARRTLGECVCARWRVGVMLRRRVESRLLGRGRQRRYAVPPDITARLVGPYMRSCAAGSEACFHPLSFFCPHKDAWATHRVHASRTPRATATARTAACIPRTHRASSPFPHPLRAAHSCKNLALLLLLTLRSTPSPALSFLPVAPTTTLPPPITLT